MMGLLRLCFSIAILGIFLASGLAAQGSATLFQMIPESQSGITFHNRIIESEVFNGITYTNAYNGSGLAVGDVNSDGLTDIFFCGTQSANRLYLNKGNFQFEDVTYKAGVADSGSIARGAVMVDFDGDADLDIYVCRISDNNTLFINNGNGTFTERAKEFGLDYNSHSTQTAFFDYDLDGDLDMYLAISGAAVNNYYARFGINDKLYRNNGNGTYTDVTKEAGIVDIGYVMNVLATDVNNDGYPDLYITNDFEAADNLYINNKNGTFTDIKSKAMLHTSGASMGSDAADFNNDGLIDIFTLDMLAHDHKREMKLNTTLSVLSPIFDSMQISRNSLQLNRGNNIFSDIGSLAGVEATDWSWPALFADFDNDGYKDLYIGNGMKRDLTDRDISYRMMADLSRLKLIQLFPQSPLPNFAYRNNRDLTFADVSQQWGLDQSTFTYGAAYADFDNDGDLDLVLNNVDSVAFLYRNMLIEQNGGSFLRIKLQGAGKNTYGLGAKVEIRAAGRYQMLEQSPVRGYLSSVEPVLHFGLERADVIDELIITWPGGATQTLTNVKANQVLTLKQSDATKQSTALAGKANVKTPPPLFTEVDTAKGINYRHEENTHDDLKRERLLPRRLSQNGPGAAVADVNGDGLEDIYFGGAQTVPGRLMLQTPSGRFLPTPDSNVIRSDSASEDMGSLFFDADNDGDMDLYVVSGGVEFWETSPELQDRLYLNDGKGRFTKAVGKLPDELTSGSCAVAGDYDADGDLDLFVGGRIIPGRYPLPAKSYILRNDNGTFRDATEEVAPGLRQPGMVCAAIWSDYDSDGRLDLVTAGEWMPVRLFHNENGRLVEVQGTGLEGATGWWNSIISADFDNDGDIDYVAGNLGLNWRYDASSDSPIEIYASDFDGNGSLDPILTYHDKKYGKEFPIFDRQRMMGQIPSIHTKFNTWESYSIAAISDIYPRPRLDSSYHLKATEFASVYVENLGNGTFKMHELPQIAQVSPNFGLTADDYDGDGNLDLVTVGNFYDGPEPMVVRYDASCGLVMKGDGKGGFTPLSPSESGFIARGDARGLFPVRVGKTNGSGTNLYQVVINNDSRAQVFKRDVAQSGSKLFTLDPKLRATHAIVKLKNGAQRRHEFSIGSGYLTQGSPTMIVTPQMASMTIYNGASSVKEVKF